MGLSKHYLNNLICACSDTQFGQDAVESAIVMGRVTLTYDFADDTREVMRQYDTLCEDHRRESSRNAALLVKRYNPIVKQITLEYIQ